MLSSHNSKLIFSTFVLPLTWKGTGVAKKGDNFITNHFFVFVFSGRRSSRSSRTSGITSRSKIRTCPCTDPARKWRKRLWWGSTWEVSRAGEMWKKFSLKFPRSFPSWQTFFPFCGQNVCFQNSHSRLSKNVLTQNNRDEQNRDKLQDVHAYF